MTSVTINPLDESLVPIPPRFRWTKWWLIASARATVALVILWAAWRYYAAARLEADVDAILARHEPLYPADFPMPKVPRGQNATFPLLRAGKLVSEDFPTPSLGNGLDLAGSPKWMSIADAALVADAASLRLARQARAFKTGAWGVSSDDFKFDPISGPSTFFPMRALAQMLKDAALASHFHGDDAESIERFQDLLHADEVFDQTPPNILDWLVSVAIYDEFYIGIERAAPTLKIFTADPSTRPIHGAAPRAQVITLIRQLADESEQRQTIQRSLLGERMLNLSRSQQLRRFLSILGPLFDLGAAKQLIVDGYSIDTLNASSWPVSKALWRAPPQFPRKPTNRQPHTMIDDLRPIQVTDLVGAYTSEPSIVIAEIPWICLAERRVAMTSLAVRLYVVDHHAWPSNLSDLVPDYLPVVPADPYDPDGRPLGFVIIHPSKPGRADRPMLFFRRPGPGTVNAPPPAAMYGGHQEGVGFQWRDLSDWPSQ